MRPARQGSLDGLCGLYAIVNSLELVGVDLPHSSRIQKDMFNQLVHGLGAVDLLSAMRGGIRPEELVATATLAFDWLKAVHGVGLDISQPLRNRRIRSVNAFLPHLRAFLDRPEAAAILSFERQSCAHWTVARSVSSKLIRLRDSDGLGALKLDDFRRPSSAWRFRIADTLTIRRVY